MDAAVVEGVIVNTPAGRVATDTADGYCDIIEAVAAASARTSVRECANPKGSTRIVLTAGTTYPTGKTLRFATAATTPTGAAQTLEFVVTGGAANEVQNAVITAAEPWLLDPGDPPTSCLLHVSGNAHVELFHVTLTQAPSLSLTGACLTSGVVTIRNSRVTGFRRGGMSAVCLPDNGCDFDAGGIATVQTANSLIDGNSTPDDGGGIYSRGFGTTLIVYHSSVVNNTAGGSGGGLYFGGGWNTHIIRSSTISGNSASTGGGVMVEFECSNTYLNVFGSTIADNTAQGTGGGIHFEPADIACSKQDVSVYSSIVAGNHSITTSEMNINSSWWTEDPMGNLGIFDCFGGSFIYVAPGNPLPAPIDLPCPMSTRDPRLGPLTVLGGASGLPVHPLLAGSPAMDIADGAYFEDQRDRRIADLDPPLPASEAWSAFDRMADGDGDGRAGPDLGAVEMSARWQTELLSVAARGPAAHRVVIAPAGLDRGGGTEYAAASAKGEFLTYRLPIAEPGFYDITVGALQTPKGGTVQLAIAENEQGPWVDLGTPLDVFAPMPTFVAFGPFRGPLFRTAGQKLLRFTVTGKSASSSGYQVSLDYLDARHASDACPAGAISVGANHSCAVTATGGVRCWGGNESGQLGDGTTANAWRAPAADAVTGVSALATGARHTCALTAAGGVRCWGANDAGQLGEVGVTVRATPPTKDLLTGVKAVAAGASHTCVLTTTGGVRCWGANEAGQLGDGTTMGKSVVPTADVLTGVKAIAAGGFTTCALMQTGGVRCWGANTFGQLGDGTTADRATPPLADVATDAAALSVGIGHTCIVTTSGGVRCWGHNGGGELGDGTLLEILTPPATDVLTGARDVAAGSNFTCALMASNGVRCWGYNSDGQIGDETPNAEERMTPPTTDILADVQAVSSGNAHVCVRTKSGGIRCWGGNGVGQLGDGLTPDAADRPPNQDIVRFGGTCR